MINRSDTIEYIEKYKLKPHFKNPRLHNNEQLAILKKSIDKYTFTNPVLIDENNTILAGHGRCEAIDDNNYLIPCLRINGLTEEEKLEYLIVDNRSFELGEYDTDLLAQLESELSGLSEILENELKEVSKEYTEDELEAVPEVTESIVKRGEIWQLGRHRIMCGDSTSKTYVDKLMDGAKCDMVFTDPPYGMFLDTDYSDMKHSDEFRIKKGAKGGNSYKKVIGDNEDFDPSLINTIFDNFNYCKEIFIWGCDYYAEYILNKNLGSWLVWDKRLSESTDKGFGSCFELCFSKSKHKRDIVRVKWFGMFGVEQEHDKKRQHPTQKPTKLVEWFIEKYSKSINEKIVDLYLGSGSTLIACENTNRICYGMELDEHYCDVIIKRWETLTNQKAVRISE